MTNHSLMMAACATLCLTLGACDNVGDAVGLSQRPQRTFLVLIDNSESIAPADRTLYVESLRAVATDLDAGDRLVVAPIVIRTGAHGVPLSI